MLTRHEEKDLRNQIANLSSGRYYDQIFHWFDLVVKTAARFGLIIDEQDCPQVYNDSGSSMIRIGDSELFIWWSWYKMPSGRWEIICYLT